MVRTFATSNAPALTAHPDVSGGAVQRNGSRLGNPRGAATASVARTYVGLHCGTFSASVD